MIQRLAAFELLSPFHNGAQNNKFLKFFVYIMPLPRADGSNFVLDIAIRILLFFLYASGNVFNDVNEYPFPSLLKAFEVTPPFKRVIHAEEVWLYKYPVTESFCPMNFLWELVIVLPSAAIFANYLHQRDRNDVIQAFLAFSLILGLNGALTNLFKVIVGRPRPDYYYRCFPNGMGNEELKDCTGDIQMINDGLKSFPSGHSSIAFACLGFLSLYAAGKMHLFSPKGKGSTWRLLLFLIPLVMAATIAISRTCDYHHHWQDVLCGSLLGFGVSWLCYHNYYPSLASDYCNVPWTTLKTRYSSENLEIKNV